MQAVHNGHIRCDQSLIAVSGNWLAYSKWNSTIEFNANLHFLSHAWMMRAYSNSTLNVRYCVNYGHNISQCYYWSGYCLYDQYSKGEQAYNVTDQTNSVDNEAGIGQISGNGRQHGVYQASQMGLYGNYSMEARHNWDMAEQHRGEFLNTNQGRRPSTVNPVNAGAPNPLSQRRQYGSSDGSRHYDTANSLGPLAVIFGQSWANSDTFRITSMYNDNDPTASGGGSHTYGNDGLST
jgi:hypothetical protein